MAAAITIGGILLILFGLSAVAQVDWGALFSGEQDQVDGELTGEGGTGFLWLIGPLMIIGGLRVVFRKYFNRNED